MKNKNLQNELSKFLFLMALVSITFPLRATFASGGRAPSADTQPVTPDLTLFTNGGSGCSGSNSIKLLNEKSGIAITFLDFQIETDGHTTPARQTCALVLPIEIPSGWQLAVEQLTLRGEMRLQAGSSLKLRLELFTAGTQGPVLETTLGADQNRTFALTLDASRDAHNDEVIATACGPTTANLRANLSATLSGGSSVATIRTLGDSKSQQLLGFKWKRCP